jgi:protein-S-isoprenylcysteine O-methyltransferase Ste14
VNESVDHADSRSSPPILTLIHLGAAFVLQWLLPLPAPPTYLRVLGGLFGLGGVVFAIFAVREFGLLHTTVEPHGSVTSIATAGPYRLSRNPIYVGYLCLLIGIPLALGTYWGLILSPLLIVLFNRLVIRYEETYLERKFGQAYLDYKSRVRRWL